MPGLLTLIGSGEVSAGMTRLHRHLLARFGAPARAAFLDTPAGFELGVETIHARFRDYVERRLEVPMELATFRSASAPPETIALALRALAGANYILAGPGSPSYAVSQWRGSAVYDAIVSRWKAGAQLVWASSAAIALSRYLLPVYEIYKVGAPLHWLDGLDLLGDYGLSLAIVTHWDNAEGGTHDTRACFMGMDRFERLRSMLPGNAVTLGIDEHTACTLDLQAGTVEVRGRSGITILASDVHRRHMHGETFPIDELRPRVTSSSRSVASAIAPAAEGRAREARDLLTRGELVPGLQLLAEAAPSELAPLLALAAQSAQGLSRATPPPDQLITLLIRVRDALRAAKQWQLSDQVRDGLSALGISLQDSPTGTTWSRAP
ncbi:MAG: hypothetical protein NTU91_04820 [Chloroflexi bacterium]|nr:hypothetical protein [Chloroflexota bacterium]